MSSSTTITLKRNNDRNLTITVTKDGAAVNITGWTIHMAVKRLRDDSDADAIFTKDVTSHDDPTGGISHIPIDAADTAEVEVGDYYYDLLFIDDDDKRQSSQTGKFKILQEITDGA